MRWVCLLALAACGSASEGVATSTSSVEIADASAPVFPASSVDTTPLVFDGPARLVTYSPEAPFLALPFTAEAGQAVAFLVDSRTSGANPGVWITDERFVSYAAKHGTNGTAVLRFTVATSGTHYLVLRETSSQRALFRVVAFDKTPLPPPAPPPVEDDAGSPAE